MRICKECNKEILRNKKFSITQWQKTIFCSLKCFGIDRKNKKWTHSIEAREKISKANQIKKPWAGRYKHTDEHNKKLREILKRVSGAGWNKGKKMPEETKLKISKSNTKNTPELRRKKKSYWEGRRRARKYKNGGTHTLQEWENLKKKYNHTCLSCKKREPEIKLTEDHIIPLIDGGADDIKNIQPLCGPCNTRKKTKTIRYEANFSPE